MSRYSGRYYRGASKDVRAAKRLEAQRKDAGHQTVTGINGYPLRDD